MRQKTAAEIQAMRDGGKILAGIFHDLKNQVKPGISEKELDAWVDKEIMRRGAIATYKTPEVAFPAAICISVNEQIVHGIPTEYVLQKGDIVSFDLVITYKGMKTDAAFTTVVGGEPNGAQKHLINATERSLYAAVDAIKGSVRTGDIGAAVEEVLKKAKLGIIRELVGHGVGHEMHQAPEVPNYGRKGTGVLLTPGDTIAIEPMATLGGERIITEDDGWTISTRDGGLAAHFEHTVLITKDGAEILTQL
ncbi:MAG: type I methionyl aminopeptidase [Candidatus Microsaccharimonas sossegonensis]|uniref:Methionine aminopeptidase n=1 Tax=Candidatus Microsaccharimonas sossegonensis TaxID=2506948 RepID=A0A4Q0AHQ8_9BACT|nr:MAG: type I methionyl aminopeptidase [Candidatus Microsaccharimonas sossegonensis]